MSNEDFTRQTRIVCAANYNTKTEQMLLGPRHWDHVMHKQMLNSKAEWYIDYEVQGFIDNRGLFLTREQAWVVANAAGQIIRRVGGDEGKLFSENLY